MRPPKICPVCHEEVPLNAKACPGCGACHKSGWNEDAASDGLDLPDEGFNYDEFVEREFGGGEPRRGIHIVWWITAAILALAFIWTLFR